MSKILYPVQFTNSPDQVTMRFRFQVNGTSDPDFIVPVNCGVTDVTYDDTAKAFTLSFDQKFPVFIGGFATAMPPAPETATTADIMLSMDVADYSATAGTLVMYSIGPDGSTAAEVPADNTWVYCQLTFCKTSTLAPSGAL